jgi:predicted metal-dependent RNase
MSSSSSSAAVSGAVVMPLGGGQEVGRSCILLQFRGKNVLLDCGVHPGRYLGHDGIQAIAVACLG